jgi:hypothetical protein
MSHVVRKQFHPVNNFITKQGKHSVMAGKHGTTHRNEQWIKEGEQLI